MVVWSATRFLRKRWRRWRQGEGRGNNNGRHNSIFKSVSLIRLSSWGNAGKRSETQPKLNEIVVVVSTNVVKGDSRVTSVVKYSKLEAVLQERE